MTALRARHADDVFIEECKNGPTWTGKHRRLDGWAMLKTWSPVTMIGYEVKVSRSDFVGDGKWPEYLPLCHQLYFVCAKGVAKSEELPAEVGLMELAGTRLVTRKKAPYRTIELPAKLLVYVLMSRLDAVRCERVTVAGRSATLDYWRKWLDTCREAKDIGWSVSRRVRELVDQVQRKENELAGREQAVKQAYEELKRIGIEPGDSWQMIRQIDRMSGAAEQRELVQRLDHFESALRTFRQAIEHRQYRQDKIKDIAC